MQQNYYKSYWEIKQDCQIWKAGAISLEVVLSCFTEDMLDSGDGGSYDFMYIDDDKESYDTYYGLALKPLWAGEIIAIDNVS